MISVAIFIEVSPIRTCVVDVVMGVLAGIKR